MVAHGWPQNHESNKFARYFRSICFINRKNANKRKTFLESLLFLLYTINQPNSSGNHGNNLFESLGTLCIESRMSTRHVRPGCCRENDNSIQPKGMRRNASIMNLLALPSNERHITLYSSSPFCRASCCILSA